MPEPRALICAPAMRPAESALRLEMLRGLSLPNSTKFVVVAGKSDKHDDARTFNIEAQYPAETACLQTLAHWAEVPDWPDARGRDGYDLFCLQRILTANQGFDVALLVRGTSGLETRWPTLLRNLSNQLYLTFETAGPQPVEIPLNVLINLKDQRAKLFLDLASQMYLTGRSYSVEPYSVDRVLEIALQGLRFKQELIGAVSRDPSNTPSAADLLAGTEGDVPPEQECAPVRSTRLVSN